MTTPLSLLPLLLSLLPRSSSSPAAVPQSAGAAAAGLAGLALAAKIAEDECDDVGVSVNISLSISINILWLDLRGTVRRSV